jgi:hypothetical protein
MLITVQILGLIKKYHYFIRPIKNFLQCMKR